MKSSVFRTLATLGLSAFSSVALLAQDKMCATIPFDFTIGVKSLAAGNYCVKKAQEHIVRIENVDKGSGIFAMTLNAESNKRSGKATLTFHRYGNSYFLARMADGSSGRQFFTSVAEQELIAKASSPQPTTERTIVASKR
jgi:hypothetical protein